MRFQGKSALVTGASAGIGLAIAEELAKAGARVVMVARREDRLAGEARRIGMGASYVPGDVTRPGTAERAVSEAVKRHGGLDLLVNNAGLLLPGGVSEQPEEEVDLVLATTLKSAISFTRAAAPHLAGRAGAAILNISSPAGKRPMAGRSIYGAAKAALDHLTRCWAIELAPRGVRVNGLSPGSTRTEAFAAAATVIPDLEERNKAGQLIKSVASKEEVARVALVLLDSDLARHVTAAVWDADGGFGLDWAR